MMIKVFILNISGFNQKFSRVCWDCIITTVIASRNAVPNKKRPNKIGAFALYKKGLSFCASFDTLSFVF